MAYNKHIDKTEEELRRLREVYSQDDIDRFTDGLESGRINNEQQVIEFTNKIRESDGLTRLEYSRLQTIQVGFIESYATNYNKRYDTTHLLMNRMRSGISRGLKMLERFCEKKRRKGHSKSKRKVIENSKMGLGSYTPSMWGLEPYRESVRVLYKEVVNYTTDLKKCIDLCIFMIEQVDKVRNDPDRAAAIYDKCHKDTVLNNRTIIKRFLSFKVDLENEIYQKMEDWEKKKKALKNLKAKLYHTLDENEWNDLCIVEEVMEARRQDISNEERALWGDNNEKVKRVRIAYAHLDELEPNGQKGMIGGHFLYRLYKWSNPLPNRGLDYWYEYFRGKYIFSGSLIPAKVSAIKAAKSKLATLDNTEDSEQQREFNSNIEKLIDKYMPKLENIAPIEKMAVNF